MINGQQAAWVSISVFRTAACRKGPPNAAKQDAPDEVMNVATAHLNIVERADLVMNEERQRPNNRYGNEETKGSPEEPLARRLGEFLTVDRGQGAGSEESADAE